MGVIKHQSAIRLISGNIRRLLRDFSRNNKGNVLPMMAVGLVVLVGLVGSGVDMSRAYNAQRRLQAACDAGVLAGRRAVTTGGFDEAAQLQATSYFRANFDPDEQQTGEPVFTPQSEDDGNVVNGDASVRLELLIGRMLNSPSLAFNLDVNCSASMGVGNSDITFVLDSTGSMANAPNGGTVNSSNPAKMTSLRKAMKAFYTTVSSSVEGSNARIRYGFVPYSSSVNIGKLIRSVNPSYLADSITIQSVHYVNWSTNPVRTWTGTDYTATTYDSTWVQHSSTSYSGTTCGGAVPADTAWANNGSSTSSTSYSVDGTTGEQVKATGVHQPQRFTDYECRKSSNKYYVYRRYGYRSQSSFNYEARSATNVTANNATFMQPVLQRRTFDVSAYKLGTQITLPLGVNTAGTATKNITSAAWAGCISERTTTPAATFSFVSIATGITPSDATDLDIDSAPSSNATKWAPLWPEPAYYRDNDVAYEGVVDSADDGDTTIVNELASQKSSTGCPQQSRLLGTMTKSAFDSYADSLVASGNTYHDLGVLWGARISSQTGMWGSLVNIEPDNGATVSRHMIFMTDGVLEPSVTVNSAYGIERHDKRITGTGNSTTQWNNHRSRFLALCEAVKARGTRLWVIAFGTSLTADLVTCATDGLASAFQADNAAELDENFQEIAKQVGELRVVQ